MIGKEPDPFAPPVRAFFGPIRVPFANLDELRKSMVNDDKILIQSIGARLIDDFWLESVESENSARTLIGPMTESKHRYKILAGLQSLVTEVYTAIAPETSPISELDTSIIDSIASRTRKAMMATVFKLDKDEGVAPDQQARNRARAVAIAEEEIADGHPHEARLPQVVGEVYEILVPGTVALQQKMFDQTYRLDDWDGIGFRGIEIPNSAA
ncbi:MAG: hypothetical protein V4493_11440 [Pseudomonadota bacterium]